MSVTAYGSVGTATARLTLPSPREAHEARAQQACSDAIDASRDVDTQANRRDRPTIANETLLDGETVLDQLRGRPSVLDRFAD